MLPPDVPETLTRSGSWSPHHKSAFSLASLDELPELGDIVETESDEDIFATRYQEGDLSETD